MKRDDIRKIFEGFKDVNVEELNGKIETLTFLRAIGSQKRNNEEKWILQDISTIHEIQIA